MFNSISIFDKINPKIFGYPLFFLLFFAAIAGYILLVMWSVPIISRVIFKKLHPTDDLRVSFFLCAVLFAVFIGEVIGVNIIDDCMFKSKQKQSKKAIFNASRSVFAAVRREILTAVTKNCHYTNYVYRYEH